MSADAAPIDVIAQLPAGLRQWLTLERHHLHKVELFQDRQRDPAFDEAFFPQNCGVMRLPCFRVPRRQLYIFSNPSARIQGQWPFRGEVQESMLLPVHPSAASLYRESLLRIGAIDVTMDTDPVWAVPTSSTRTLLAWCDGAPSTAVFVKTSLHSPIFGDRRIHRMRAARSVALSAILDSEAESMPASFNYMRESVAVVTRCPPHSGTIFRSIPPQIIDGTVSAAPLFSLLGGKDRTPLMLSLLERSDTSPLQLVEQLLCEPFAKLWLDLSLNLGFILEAHGQDLLLEISPTLHPTGRFYYRDLEGLQVDWTLRRHLGRAAPHDMPHGWEWRDAYDTVRSYRYGGLLFYKWQTSLFLYIRLVLTETELSLAEWHRRGLIGGRSIQSGDITSLFSRHLFNELRQRYGVHVDDVYDISAHLNRFTLLLMEARRRCMSADMPNVTDVTRAASRQTQTLARFS